MSDEERLAIAVRTGRRLIAALEMTTEAYESVNEDMNELRAAIGRDPASSDGLALEMLTFTNNCRKSLLLAEEGVRL